MKIGAKVHYFNYEMRSRRKERGWTQKRLAEESGVNMDCLGRIERLVQPRSRISTANDNLLKIARALEVEFEVLFPVEYLALLEAKLLSRRRSSYVWVREISLDQLADTTPELLVPGPEVTVIDAEMRDEVLDLVGGLPPREARVVEMRFGLNGAERGTQQEVGAALGMTSGRVSQMERSALRRLRHPGRAGKLREYVGRGRRRDEEHQEHEPQEDRLEWQKRVGMAVRKENRARARRRAPRDVAVDGDRRARAISKARAYQGGIRFRVANRADAGEGG